MAERKAMCEFSVWVIGEPKLTETVTAATRRQARRRFWWHINEWFSIPLGEVRAKQLRQKDEEIKRAEEIEELRQEIEDAEYEIDAASEAIKEAKRRLRNLGVDPNGRGEG